MNSLMTASTAIKSMHYHQTVISLVVPVESSVATIGA